MSLRTEIRTTLEEFAPSAPQLERDVRERLRALQAPARADRRVLMFRAPLTLVAAVLIVVLMAALVVGGHIFRDGNTPAGPTHVVNQAELKRLEARPLQLPVVQAGAACPEGPTSDGAFGHGGGEVSFGAGPVYANRGSRGRDAWGTWAGVGYIIDPKYSGTMLVRARDLQTGQLIVFSDIAQTGASYAEFTAPGIPEGRSVGTRYDPVWHQTLRVYPELVMLAPGSAFQGPGWPGVWATIGIPGSSSGCVGFQIDGADFTEVYVVNETD